MTSPHITIIQLSTIKHVIDPSLVICIVTQCHRHSYNPCMILAIFIASISWTYTTSTALILLGSDQILIFDVQGRKTAPTNRKVTWKNQDLKPNFKTKKKYVHIFSDIIEYHSYSQIRNTSSSLTTKLHHQSPSIRTRWKHHAISLECLEAVQSGTKLWWLGCCLTNDLYLQSIYLCLLCEFFENKGHPSRTKT